MGTDISPVYSKPFFELQLIFAQKIADLQQQPLEQSVRCYTAFYRIFGLDWSLDPTHPVWQSYMQGFRQAPSPVDYTHEFYLQRYDSIPKFTDDEHWGCFAYTYNHGIIHPHFSDEDRSPYGPLSHHRIDVRKGELKAMFTTIHQRHSDAELVHGGSWLYNWESYRRLFPPLFSQSAHEDKTPGRDIWGQLRGRAIWNQFLRRNWQVHEETTSLFLKRVGALERAEDYLRCFPYPPLFTEAPIQEFYTFYAIEER